MRIIAAGTAGAAAASTASELRTRVTLLMPEHPSWLELLCTVLRSVPRNAGDPPSPEQPFGPAGMVGSAQSGTRPDPVVLSAGAQRPAANAAPAPRDTTQPRKQTRALPLTPGFQWRSSQTHILTTPGDKYPVLLN